MASFLLAISTLLIAFSSASSQPYIGVNYGEVADNLPPPEATVKLLQSTTISKVRLFGANPSLLRALAGTGISAVIGGANGDIPSLAADPSAASRWVAANVLPYLPATRISTIALGNEALTSGDPALATQLLPAMENLHSALAAAGGPAAAVKVSTVHIMTILAKSEPPSSGAFHADLIPGMKSILGFLNRTGSPLMINPYPYFAYQSDRRPETLAFCLFQPNPGRYDPGTKATYTNMFDAQVAGVRAAAAAVGFPAVEIVAAETGWPYSGDAATEAGASPENARAYVSGLVGHLKSMGKPVETYIFALYDEDLKPGAASERAFGLYRADMTPAYDAGLSAAAADAAAPAAKGGWCVPRAAAAAEELQADLDYACSRPEVDCGPIQPGGACFLPNDVRSHAAFAMNQLYHVLGKHPWNCDFRASAELTSEDPSHDSCVYKGS